MSQYNDAFYTDIYFDEERLFFNKWEMYKLLVPHNLPFQIPYTELLSFSSLDRFTSGSAPFYIKPVDTWLGKDITLITPTHQGFMIQMPNGASQFVTTKQNLTHIIFQQYAKSIAIIQQQAPLVSANRRAFDIRVHLQRDELGQWLYAGDLIRIGGEGAVVSNLFAKGGGIVETDAILNQLYSPNNAYVTREKLTNSAFAIARLLDHYYPFIDIGADFGIDHEGNLWLLEVNTNDRNGRPAYDLFKKLPNKTIYKQMIAKDKQRKKFWSKNKV
ncbi:YheC/YheD family protein [Aquibacillus sediminis]|uniref:YheC/YheD family protein n=1 Tax=Aquibacillus sediminis TaxID=2574734 RepID=UPI001107BDEE|nr:YheC/YheD family protein [Aquibacillus sediminis]